MKACSRCNVEKNSGQFYPSNQRVCKNCLATQMRERYLKIKDTPEYKRKHAAQNKAIYHRDKEKFNKRQKIYRDSEQGKATRKKYIEKNKEKLYKQEFITKKRHRDKNKEALSDTYAVHLLKTQGNKTPTQNDIEIKKAKVLLSRIKKKIREQKRS